MIKFWVMELGYTARARTDHLWEDIQEHVCRVNGWGDDQKLTVISRVAPGVYDVTMSHDTEGPIEYTVRLSAP